MKREWTKEEENFLLSHCDRQTIHQIAKKLNRSFKYIAKKGEELGVTFHTNKRTWSESEINYLQDHFGNKSLKAIAKNLGRSFYAIKNKAYKLGLGDPILHYHGISVCQLAKELGVEYTQLMLWMQDFNFPARTKLFVKEQRVLVVDYDDFWKWAEKHKHILNFSRLEKHALGPEPDWVAIKRDADSLSSQKIKKRAWSKEDDSKLRGMVKAQTYSYPEIAQALNRSESAVKRRLYDLGIKARPLRAKSVKWTYEQERLLLELVHKGYGLDYIGERVGKSGLAVRGKLENMGFTFRLGMPQQKSSKRKKVL